MAPSTNGQQNQTSQSIESDISRVSKVMHLMAQKDRSRRKLTAIHSALSRGDPSHDCHNVQKINEAKTRETKRRMSALDLEPEEELKHIEKQLEADVA